MCIRDSIYVIVVEGYVCVLCGVMVIFMFFYCMVWKLEREKVYLAIVSSVIVGECKRKKFEVNIKPIYIQLFFYFCFSMYLSLWNVPWLVE